MQVLLFEQPRFRSAEFVFAACITAILPGRFRVTADPSEFDDAAANRYVDLRRMTAGGAGPAHAALSEKRSKVTRVAMARLRDACW